MITVNSREFNQRLAHVKQQAKNEPVVITNRGKPELVLITHAEYRKLTCKPETLADALGYTEAAEIEFSPERVKISFRDVEF